MLRDPRGVPVLAALAVALSLAAPHSAEAGFKLRITDDAGNRVTIADNVVASDPNASDLSRIVGKILASADDAFQDIASTTNVGVSKPVTGAGRFAALDLSSLTSTGAGEGTLTLDLTDTGFSFGAAPLRVDLTSSVTLNQVPGGSITYQSWVDYGPGGNTEFGGLDAGLGGTIATTGLQGPIAGAAQGDTRLLDFLVSGPFSLTTRVVLSFTSGSSGSPFSIDARAAVATPEPSTLVGGTLGVLAGLGYAWRRRRAAATPAASA